MDIISKDSLIGDVLLEHPEGQEIMIKYFGEQVACTFCPGQAFDTFAMIAELHGIEEDAVDAMMKEMNEVVAEKLAERSAI